MTTDELIQSQLGVLTRAMLRDSGVSDHQMRKWVAERTAVELSRSVLAFRSAPPALVRAGQLGGKVGCVTAARVRGLWVIDDGCFHLTVRNNHSRPSDGFAPKVRFHWQSRPIDPAGALVALESVWDMFAHVAVCQPVDRAVAIFDSALNQGHVTPAELERLAAASTSRRLAEVILLTSPLADSGLESITRVGLAWRGVTCREQVVIDGHPVDLLIGSKLVIQLDGLQHLKDPVQLARDRAQDRRLRRAGYIVLRYGYADVIHHWDRTLAEILSFVAGSELRSATR